MVRYYIDTCIWRDLIENRSDRFRSLGEDARGFFQRCAESGGIIVWSPLVEHELHHPESQQAMNVILARFQKHGRANRISPSFADLREAQATAVERNIRDLDALHAILARNAKAILVTRNGQLQRAEGIVEVKKPEDLM